MKKIQCLFERAFAPRANGRGSEVTLLDTVTPGCERVLVEGIPTVKIDGTACAVIASDGFMSWVPFALRSPYHLFRRYDAKRGKPAPANGIPCDDPDSVTGHWPHWIPVGDEAESKWMRTAYLRLSRPLLPASYEFAGPHVQGNPQKYPEDVFVKHGVQTLFRACDLVGRQDVTVDMRVNAVECTFEGLRSFLTSHAIEGIVFWLDGEARAKIRRKDYGLAWPIRSVG